MISPTIMIIAVLIKIKIKKINNFFFIIRLGLKHGKELMGIFLSLVCPTRTRKWVGGAMVVVCRLEL